MQSFIQFPWKDFKSTLKNKKCVHSTIQKNEHDQKIHTESAERSNVCRIKEKQKIWDALLYAWDEQNHAFVHDISKNCS